jgi:hypothetical protein
MALGNLIETIYSNPGRYATQYWSYRLTYNCLELTVNPKYLIDDELNRVALIHCGMVLKAMDCEALNNGYMLHIQTFPEINRNQLVAIIRKLKMKTKCRPGENICCPDINPDLPLLNLFEISAASFNLLLLNFHNKPAVSSLNGENMPVSEVHNDTDCMNLCSYTDNPFIWLKIGYWLEYIEQLKMQRSDSKNIQIDFGLPKQDRAHFEDPQSNHYYRQAVLQF